MSALEHRDVAEEQGPGIEDGAGDVPAGPIPCAPDQGAVLRTR